MSEVRPRPAAGAESWPFLQLGPDPKTNDALSEKAGTAGRRRPDRQCECRGRRGWRATRAWLSWRPRRWAAASSVFAGDSTWRRPRRATSTLRSARLRDFLETARALDVGAARRRQPALDHPRQTPRQCWHQRAAFGFKPGVKEQEGTRSARRRVSGAQGDRPQAAGVRRPRRSRTKASPTGRGVFQDAQGTGGVQDRHYGDGQGT